MFGIGMYELLIVGMMLLCPLVIAGIVLVVVLANQKKNPPTQD